MQTTTTLRDRPLLNIVCASLALALCAACGSGGAGDAGSPVAVAPPVSGGGSGTPPVSTVPPVVTPALSVLAGNSLEAGTVDGSGADSRFNGPGSITIDSAGNLYAGASCAIRKITTTGAVSLFAGAYCAPGTLEGFPSAFTLASAADGRLFMTYNRDVFEVSQAGVARKVAALEEAAGGGRGAAIAHADGIAADAAGNLVVTNWIGVRRIAPTGSYTMLDGVASTTAGINSNTFIPERRGVAVDAAGTVYLAANDNTLVRIDADGKKTVLAGGPGGGANDGTGAEARFSHIIALAVDSKGNLYAADSSNTAWPNQPPFTALIRKITPAGVVTTIAGTPGVSELETGALPGSLAPLGGIALDGKGNLYATSGNAIVKIVLP